MRVRSVALLLAGALALGVLGGSRPAAAQDRSLTASEAAALARDAVDSDAALAELREVSEVDGRPVDLEAVTTGLTDPTVRRARLTALAQALEARRSSGRTSSAEARAAAHDVVTGRDYRRKELPKPFRGPLRWVRDRLAPVFRPIGDAADSLLHHTGPLGFVTFWAIVAGLTGLIAWLITRRSRARVVEAERRGGGLVDPEADPDELRRLAEAALDAGDHREALRLFFAEGVLRLARGGRLQLRPDTTASRAAEEVGGDDIAVLAHQFEAVVYGGAPVSRAEVDAARSRWTSMLGAKAAR